MDFVTLFIALAFIIHHANHITDLRKRVQVLEERLKAQQ